MNRPYFYVGPKNLFDLAQSQQTNVHTLINSTQDIVGWLRESEQPLNKAKETVATFIITTGNKLWIADRGIEHVVCAKGEPVLAAGEITFRSKDNFVEISDITNQSTGYCPEPVSWKAVVQTLDRLQIKYPPYWTMQFIFRRCPSCGMINLVKDDWYYCNLCETELPRSWNFSG